MFPAKSHILCVDDESCYEMLDVLLNLEKPAYQVVGTDSVNEALEMIANEKFNLYLIECFLPEKSGVEFITITDKNGLEDFTCECYGIVKKEYERRTLTY